MATYPVLQLGGPNKKDDVKKLNKLLEEWYPEFPNGHSATFDGDTKTYVETFQRDAGLVRDGVCGPNTWRALLGEDIDVNFEGEFTQRPQPNPAHCWKAAVAMVRDCPVAMVQHGTADYFNGGLGNEPENLRLFAREQGLRYESYPFSLYVHIILHMHRRFMVNIDDDYAGYKAGNDSHWVVIGRMRSDGSEAGTTFSISDPAPTNLGNRSAMSFKRLKSLYRGFMYREL
jgi:hypothetical protein